PPEIQEIASSRILENAGNSRVFNEVLRRVGLAMEESNACTLTSAWPWWQQLLTEPQRLISIKRQNPPGFSPTGALPAHLASSAMSISNAAGLLNRHSSGKQEIM